MILKSFISLLEIQVKHLMSQPFLAGLSILSAAVVAAVFTAAMAIAAGINNAVERAGAVDIVLVMRTGATAEANSLLDGPSVEILRGAPGVVQGKSGAMISPEFYSVMEIEQGDGKKTLNIPMRGVDARGLALHDIQIVKGRMFETGRAEVIVGQLAQSRYGHIDVGGKLRLGNSDWEVVGVFSSNGTVEESELWSDLGVAQSLFGRNNTVQSVRLLMEEGKNAEMVNKWIETEPRLSAFAQSEPAYYARQARSLTSLINGLGYPLSLMLAAGAVAGALNSMQAAVIARRRIFATLRSFGYSHRLVMASTVIEALFLALIGALLGFGFTYVGLDGSGTSMLSNETNSQVVFSVSVEGRFLRESIVLALLIGILGGAWPAIQSARFALRAELADR